MRKYQARVVLGLLLALASIGSVRLADAAEPKSNHEAHFHIQAHRGAGVKLPENTLESFATCWRVHVTPEADLQTTQDGAIVCFHDSNLKRVVSNVTGDERKLGIAALTLAEVRGLEVGAFRGEQYRGQRVPTLPQVFSAMKGRSDRMIYLDIKKVELDELVALVRKFDVESQVIFATSQHGLIIDWKKRLPKSKTLLWNGGSQGSIAKKLNSVRQREFEGITHLQIHVRAGDLDSDKPFAPSPAFLEAIRDELKSRDIVFQVYVVMCADRRAYVKLLELGVGSFATDYPQVTLDAVREFQRNKANQ